MDCTLSCCSARALSGTSVMPTAFRKGILVRSVPRHGMRSDWWE